MQLQTGWRPGLIGAIATAHGQHYAEHWGFGVAFEAKVASDCAAFMLRAQPDDLTLSAWQGEQFAGSLILDLNDPEARPGEAHLRWFIVPSRGRGLGKDLMARAMAHLDHHRRPCFLTTFAGLDAARSLYERHGFALTDERGGETWGTRVTEQRFDRPAP